MSSVVAGYYRPLTLTSLMLDWAMGGRPEDLRVFHRTSLTLHVGCTVLIFLLCYQVFGRAVVAAIVGLLFGLHPMTVEPIAWVMERKTILAAIFAFGCLNAYVRYTRVGGKRWYIAAVLLYLISLPAKQSLLYLPLRLCWLAVFYPYKILLPVNLTSVYMLPVPLALSNPTVLLAVVFVAVMVAVLVLYRRRVPALWVSAAIFYVGLSPTMGFVGYSWVAASDKYAYLPVVGLLLLLGWLLGLLVGGPAKARPAWRLPAVIAGVMFVAVLLAIGTRRYIAEWQTGERHEFYMYRLAPDSPFTNYGCGRIYQGKGELDKALQYYNRAIELKPDDKPSIYNRAVLYGDLKMFDLALQDYTRAIELRPNFVQAYCNRGAIFSKLRDYDRAIIDCNKAIELQPGFTNAYSNRGNVYKELQDYECAIRDFNRAIELNPGLAEAYNNRGLVYDDMKDYERALADFSQAIELKPNFVEAYVNRGNACLLLGYYERAIVDFDKVIALKPENVLAYYRRGNAHAWLGAYDRAIADCTRAIELNPDHVEAYNTRATAHIHLKHYRQAIKDCSRAIALQSGHVMAYNNRAISHYWIAEYDKAWSDVEKCQQLGGQVSPGFLEALKKASDRPQ